MTGAESKKADRKSLLLKGAYFLRDFDDDDDDRYGWSNLNGEGVKNGIAQHKIGICILCLISLLAEQ